MPPPTGAKITKLSGPDYLGRVSYIVDWHNPNKPYCAVCGKSPERTCEHLGTYGYGRCAQLFFRRLEGVPVVARALPGTIETD